MAGKKNGKRSLEEILEEHLEVTKQSFDELRGDMNRGFTEMRQGFKRIEGRLDDMLRTMGRSRHDHETRVTALEADVARLKKAG